MAVDSYILLTQSIAPWTVWLTRRRCWKRHPNHLIGMGVSKRQTEEGPPLPLLRVKDAC